MVKMSVSVKRDDRRVPAGSSKPGIEVTAWIEVLGYGAVLALAAFLISWLEIRHATLHLPTELYVVVIAIAFACLGIWVGTRLTGVPQQANPGDRKTRLARLGISAREAAVLDLLAEGHSNKEIARILGISPNTVKTHVARLFDKLGVNRRTQALHRAREMLLIR